MNTYLRIEGIENPVLLLESTDQIPEGIEQAVETILINRLNAAETDNSFEAQRLARNAYFALTVAGSPDYAGRIEKDGAIVVNSNGGMDTYNPEVEIERWTAESCEEAII